MYNAQSEEFKEIIRHELREHEKAIDNFNRYIQMAPNSWMAHQLHIMNNYHKDEAWRLAIMLHMLEYPLSY